MSITSIGETRKGSHECFASNSNKLAIKKAKFVVTNMKIAKIITN